jgi:hypothetical protein
LEIKTQEIPFDKAYLNSRLERYAGYRGFVAYKKDFELIVANAGAILELFRRPYLRENGAKLKDKLVKLVQLALVTSIDDHCEKVGDLLNDFFGFMLESLENADYSEIEIFFAQHISDIHPLRNDMDAQEKATKIMQFLFTKNDVLIQSLLREDAHLSWILNKQSQISRALQFLLHRKEGSLDEFLFNKRYSIPSRQVFIDEMVFMYGTIPAGLIVQSEKKAAKIEVELGKYPRPYAALQVIKRHHLPVQALYPFLEGNSVRALLRSIIADTTRPALHRVFALWQLHLVFQEYDDLEDEFIATTEHLLDKFQKAKAIRSNGAYLDAKDAIAIYTAVAISCFGKDKAQYAQALKNLKWSFADSRYAFLLGDFKNTYEEKLTLPLSDPKEYVRIIRDAIA